MPKILRVDSLGRDNTKSRVPKGLNRKTIVHWWNKGPQWSIGRLAKKFKCSEQNICYHIRGAHDDGVPVRMLNARLSHAISTEISVAHEYRNRPADEFFEKLTAYQRVLLGLLLREKDKSFMAEQAGAYNFQTRRALLRRGMVYWQKVHGKWVLTITDRGQHASNTHPPVEVYLAELKK